MKHRKQSVRASVWGPSRPETVDTPRSRIEARLSDVSEFVETRAMDPADGPEDFAQFEEEFERIVAKLKGEIIAKKMGASDVDADAIVSDAHSGSRQLRSAVTFGATCRNTSGLS